MFDVSIKGLAMTQKQGEIMREIAATYLLEKIIKICNKNEVGLYSDYNLSTRRGLFNT